MPCKLKDGLITRGCPGEGEWGLWVGYLASVHVKGLVTGTGFS